MFSLLDFKNLNNEIIDQSLKYGKIRKKYNILGLKSCDLF